MFSLKAKEQLFCKHKAMFSTSPKSRKTAQGERTSKVVQFNHSRSAYSPPSPLCPLPLKGGLRLYLSTSGVYSTLGNFFALQSVNCSYFCHLQLLWHQYWAPLSAKSFTNISFNPHHSPGSVIISILQFRKLREVTCLPKIPQLAHGKASR